MLRVGAVFLALLTVSLCATAQDGPDLAFIGVNVVDVEQGLILADQTVTIMDGQISGVSSTSEAVTDAAARLVDGGGAYLIPGLWDMHTHVIDPDTPGGLDVVLPLFIANGVIGIRDLGSSDLDAILRLREDTQDETQLGPRIVTSGKLLDGIPAVFPPDAIEIRTPEEGREMVDMLASRGVDTIKAYELLQRDVFVAVVEAAARHGLPVAAHPPLSVDVGETSDLGVKSIEHLRNIELACSSEAEELLAERLPIMAEAMEQSRPDTRAYEWSGGYGSGALVRGRIHAQQRPRALQTYDEARCEALLNKLADNETWQTPNLMVQQRAHIRPDHMPAVVETLSYVPEAYLEAWGGDSEGLDSSSAEDKAQAAAQSEWFSDLVARMRDIGIGLLAGSDVSNPWMVPGFSLHEELQALVRAGLTPLEALQTATLNPARFLNEEDSFGRIEPGLAANLVLLDANPLEDISNTMRIRGVMQRGEYLDRTALDELLDDAQRAAERE